MKKILFGLKLVNVSFLVGLITGSVLSNEKVRNKIMDKVIASKSVIDVL
ncbi:MAG: hypothetical protein UDO63_04525 [Oscillospiraceae bacterium]